MSDYIAGASLILKMMKKKEFKQYPIAFLFAYSVPCEDVNGAIAMCKTVTSLHKQKKFKEFSASNYVLPKYFYS